MSQDLVAQKMSWLDRMITHPDNGTLFTDDAQLEIHKELSTRWVNENRLDLLNDLAATYGQERVLTVIDQIITAASTRDWEEAARENENTLANFIKLLWEPLLQAGFAYTYQQEGNVTRFCVTQCPIYELARQTGGEKWLYHLACLTDESSVTGFNPEIQFSRTRTLMQGCPDCDHTYTDLSK
jgi:predicted ArsR family transcriptional regulator